MEPQFADEGDTVEVRLAVPEKLIGNLKTNQVAVTVHEDSLLVTISTEDELVPLLIANPLYSVVIPSKTIWQVPLQTFLHPFSSILLSLACHGFD